MLSSPLLDFLSVVNTITFAFVSKITYFWEETVHFFCVLKISETIVVCHTVQKHQLSQEHGCVLQGSIYLTFGPKKTHLRCVFQGRNFFF